AMKGPSIGHVSPEAADGGPIALVEEGDLIEIDIPKRKLAIVGLHGRKATEEEVTRVLAERRAAWTPPPPRHTSGILSLFSRVAPSASSGGSLTPPSTVAPRAPAVAQEPASEQADTSAASEALEAAVEAESTPPEARREEHVKVVVLDYDFGDIDVERA